MLVVFRLSLAQTRLFRARPRFYSSLPATSTPSGGHKNLKALLFRVRTFLGEPANYPDVNAYINTVLNRNLTSVPHAAVLYENIIEMLLSQRFYKEAVDIYQRMLNEQVVPTLETRAQMLALAFSLSQSDDEINKAVDTFFINDDLTQGHIARILEHAIHFEASSDRIAQIQERLVAQRDGFIPTQGLVAKLVGAQVREGNLDAAFATILQHGDSETTDPYAAMINALRDTKSDELQSLNLILGLMSEKGIKPDSTVINSLLSWELHRQSIPKLWKIYHVMKLEAEKNAITPDATTFGILFSSFLQSRGKDMAISPRSVYYDMVHFHKRVPIKMTTHLMNIVLRVFMEGRDYAGAFITLRSFRVYKIRVSARTYSVALRHIVHRITTAIKDQTGTKYRWPCAFLRVSAQELRELKPDSELLEAIMAFSRTSTFEITRGIMEKRPDDMGDYITPSLEQINNDMTPNSFSMLPLERILLRAILAGTPDLQDPRPGLLVGKRIKEARREMIPSAS